MNRLNTVIERTNSLAVVTVMTDRLDEPAAQELTEELMDRARCDGVIFFVLDMAAVDYVNTPCLASLITFVQDLQPMRGRIVLANCRPNVKTVMKLTKLDRLFGLCDDLDEARAELTP